MDVVLKTSAVVRRSVVGEQEEKMERCGVKIKPSALGNIIAEELSCTRL